MKLPTLPPRLRFAFLLPALAFHGGIYGPAPVTPGPTGLPGTPGPSTVGPKTPRGAGPAPLTASADVGVERASWWTWWERNRFDYLVPVRARVDTPTTTGEDLFAERVSRRLAQSLAGRRT